MSIMQEVDALLVKSRNFAIFQAWSGKRYVLQQNVNFAKILLLAKDLTSYRLYCFRKLTNGYTYFLTISACFDITTKVLAKNSQGLYYLIILVSFLHSPNC